MKAQTCMNAWKLPSTSSLPTGRITAYLRITKTATENLKHGHLEWETVHETKLCIYRFIFQWARIILLWYCQVTERLLKCEKQFHLTAWHHQHSRLNFHQDACDIALHRVDFRTLWNINDQTFLRQQLATFNRYVFLQRLSIISFIRS